MKVTDISTLLLRLALASGFLSAIASRLGLWGKQSWGYTVQVNSFLSEKFIPVFSSGNHSGYQMEHRPISV